MLEAQEARHGNGEAAQSLEMVVNFTGVTRAVPIIELQSIHSIQEDCLLPLRPGIVKS